MTRRLTTVGVWLIVACCARAAVADDGFRLLHGNHEALQARVDLIQQATTEIDTSYYQIDDDQVGALFLLALRDAALRGVRVRLVIDASHNNIPAPVERHLVASGVTIKEFHPSGEGEHGWLNRRMHDKVLVVDRAHLVVGSRNISNAHFGLAPLNYVDRDAYLRGEVVEQARRYFHCLWTSDEVRYTDFESGCLQRLQQRFAPNTDATLPKKATAANPSARGCRSAECCAALPSSPVCFSSGGPMAFVCDPEAWLASGLGLVVCGQPIEWDAPRDWSREACPVGPVCLVYDPRGVKGHPLGISQQLLGLIDGARSSIVIETPYFVMSTAFKRALAAATGRGVQVTVLTNSLASTDHQLVTATFNNQKHWLLSHGVQIWELAGPDHLHAKTAVFDRSIAYVGSYNFDPRSEYLNTETGAVIHDPAAAELVLASVGEHLSRAYQMDAHGRAIATGTRQPGASPRQVLRMWSTRIVAPLLRWTL